MTFKSLKLDPKLVQGLEKLNITDPTDIQRETIPHILKSQGPNVLGQAKTGTGKTLAFVLPLLQLVDASEHRVQAVIIVPTRELCKQVNGVFRKLAYIKKVRLVEVYGGVSINAQIKKIRNGAQIVVATPGRLIDITKRNKINMHSVDFVVLDEADRMLDMGFLPDIKYLLLRGMQGANPRLLLFSATLAKKLKSVVKQFTNGRDIVEINVSEDEKTVKNCDLFHYRIKDPKKKYAYLVEIINDEKPKNMIIFMNTRRKADKLYRRIRNEKQIRNEVYFKSAVLHGGVTQARREKVTRRFREKDVNCLIATNVAARGLDFPKVTHIVNYDFPRGRDAPDKYIHRIGRTARIDSDNDGETRDGIAHSFVLRDDVKNLEKVQKTIKREIHRKNLPVISPIETYNYVRRRKKRSRSRKHRTNNRKSGKRRHKSKSSNRLKYSKSKKR